MTTLYQLTDEFQVALRDIEGMQLSGEIDSDTAADTLEGLEGELVDKVRNVGLHIKNLRSDLDQLKQAKDQFDARIKSAKDKIEWYEKYLYTNIVKTKCPAISDGQVSIRLKPMPDLVNITATEVPLKYSTLKPSSSTPDRKLILKELKAGAKFVFADLITDRTALELK